MTPTETAAAILSAIFFMVMVVIAIQSAESQRRERQLTLLFILNKIRGVEHLLNNIPHHFVSKTLRATLAQHLQNLWQDASRFDRSINLEEKYRSIEAIKESPLKIIDHPEGQLTLFSDRNTAQRNRSIVRETAQLITRLRSEGILDSQLHTSLLKQIKSHYIRCDNDLMVLEALQDEQAHKPLVAFHKLRSANTQLCKLEVIHDSDKQLKAIELKINAIDHALNRAPSILNSEDVDVIKPSVS